MSIGSNLEKMKTRQSLIICLTYPILMVLGSVMYIYLEREVHEWTEVEELREWTRLKELALQEYSPEDEMVDLAIWLSRNCTDVSQSTIETLRREGSQKEAVMEVESMCPHLHVEEFNTATDYHMDFADAFYFTMTVWTTIGYGNYYPIRPAGRFMCIIYALVGIPLTVIFFVCISEFFGKLLFTLFKFKLNKKQQHSNKIIAAATCIYIAIGFVVFIFLPAIVFMELEGWSYFNSVYYGFITFTTIGFGDLYTGTYTEEVYNKYIYHFCVVIWIMVGFSYWFVVANFIIKALKSKHLQSSVLRRTEKMKTLMQQMGIKNHDPRFLQQHSKATFKFLLQCALSPRLKQSIEDEDENDAEINAMVEALFLKGEEDASTELEIRDETDSHGNANSHSPNSDEQILMPLRSSSCTN